MDVGSILASIKIGKMVNMVCVRTIEGQIGRQTGVIRINVFLQKELAEIVYDPSLTNIEKLCQAIEDIGYEASPSVDEDDEDASGDSDDVLETIINVEGMVCMSCVDSIESVVGDRAGVAEIKVSLAGKTATIKYYPSKETVDTLVEAISDMGFDATPANHPEETDRKAVKAVIGITGMTCNSCVQSIEKMISDVSGIVSIKVSLESENAVVFYEPDLITAEKICDEIDDMGFEARISRSSKSSSCFFQILLSILYSSLIVKNIVVMF